MCDLFVKKTPEGQLAVNPPPIVPSSCKYFGLSFGEIQVESGVAASSLTDALPIAKARGFSLVVVRTLTILRWSLVRDLRSFEPTRSGAEDVYALEASLPHSRVRGTLLAACARFQATPRA